MKPIALIFFLILILALVLYLIGKAPQWLEPLSFSANPNVVRTPTTGWSTYSGSNSPSWGSSDSSYLSSISDSQIPQGFTRADLSSSFGKVRIGSAFNTFGGARQEIRLLAYLNSGETANISGWKIKSNRGEIVITQAIHSYEPAGFSTPSDIILKGNNTVVISSGISPLSRNFRLNKCIGYLNNIYSFNPPLPQNCPLPSEQNIAGLSGQCQTYIRSLSSCALPNPTIYNSFPGNAEGNACRNFLNGITYKSCYEQHQNDADFYSNEWRLWGSQIFLDPQHDTVHLYDRQGLLVDQYQY